MMVLLQVPAHQLGLVLVVLDWMIEGISGIEVCRRLRRSSQTANVPIIMLTGRTEEADRIRGLETGADDFVTKPFSPRELVARVRTLLRRVPADKPEPVLEVGPIVVDQLRHEVRVRGGLVECTPGEFGLLEVLASEVDRVFSREQLLERMHGIDSFLTTRTIDTHVKNLRRKIETDPRVTAHLVTVYGIGYKLTAGRADAP